MSWQARPVAWAVTLALGLSACGGGDDDATQAPASPTAAPTTATEETATPAPTATPTGDAGDQRATRTYEVKRGDTLSAIAQRFDTTVDALVELNDLDDPDTIFPGDELKVPRK